MVVDFKAWERNGEDLRQQRIAYLRTRIEYYEENAFVPKYMSVEQYQEIVTELAALLLSQ
jgi:hypothetical protein